MTLNAESKATPAELQKVVKQLMGIMEREIDGATPSPDDIGPDSIARLGLDSLALIGFLVAVEDEFKIDWGVDADLEVLRSFEAMAGYILAQGAGSP
ncbi:MAG TPA: phosphopantetheine-binding protein [Solirubrobacterales bacterium]|nr:phosphopantetheine-binding protein [Solirubrobacterales bacterium]